MNNFINADELDRSYIVRVNIIPFPSKKYLPEVDKAIILRMIDIDYNITDTYIGSDCFKQDLRKFIHGE